jgi:hypothetical protein
MDDAQARFIADTVNDIIAQRSDCDPNCDHKVYPNMIKDAANAYGKETQ